MAEPRNISMGVGALLLLAGIAVGVGLDRTLTQPEPKWQPTIDLLSGSIFVPCIPDEGKCTVLPPPDEMTALVDTMKTMQQACSLTQESLCQKGCTCPPQAGQPSECSELCKTYTQANCSDYHLFSTCSDFTAVAKTN